MESTKAVDMKRNIVISNTDTCKDVQGGECDSKNKLKTTITGNGKKYEAVHLITKEECKLENAEGTLQPTAQRLKSMIYKNFFIWVLDYWYCMELLIKKRHDK